MLAPVHVHVHTGTHPGIPGSMFSLVTSCMMYHMHMYIYMCVSIYIVYMTALAISYAKSSDPYAQCWFP